MVLSNRRKQQFEGEAMSNNFAQIVQWIDQQNGNHIKVSDLASRFYLSQRQLYRLFVVETGHGPKAYLDAVRIRTLETLLRERRPQEEILEKCGFGDRTAMRAFLRRCQKNKNQED